MPPEDALARLNAKLAKEALIRSARRSLGFSWLLLMLRVPSAGLSGPTISYLLAVRQASRLESVSASCQAARA